MHSPSSSVRYSFADFRRNFDQLNADSEVYYNSMALWKTVEFKGIEILVEYNFERGIYLCHFRRNDGREYAPKEVEFDAFTWETLFQHINTELRTTPFQEFVGVLNKKKISNLLRNEFEPIFHVKEDPREEI
ncbi:MAG: hypothetical protein JW776_12985 [Candidatus Lokiarchaeota archaeon]|nr:hypothetical protein [Candidatus Lokiarchaeota archaeon]